MASTIQYAPAFSTYPAAQTFRLYQAFTHHSNAFGLTSYDQKIAWELDKGALSLCHSICQGIIQDPDAPLEECIEAYFLLSFHQDDDEVCCDYLHMAINACLTWERQSRVPVVHERRVVFEKSKLMLEARMRRAQYFQKEIIGRMSG